MCSPRFVGAKEEGSFLTYPFCCQTWSPTHDSSAPESSKRRKIAEEAPEEPIRESNALHIGGEKIDVEDEVKKEDGRKFDWDMLFVEFRQSYPDNYRVLEEAINEIETKLGMQSCFGAVENVCFICIVFVNPHWFCYFTALIQPSEYMFRQRNELLDWMDGLIMLGVCETKSEVVSKMLVPIAKEPFVKPHRYQHPE
jgi:hypothetical protein